jgi:hypothetical protein
MSVTFETRADTLTAVLKDGKQIGVITRSPTGQVGYSVFGTPHQGPAKDVDEARETVLRILA